MATLTAGTLAFAGAGPALAGGAPPAAGFAAATTYGSGGVRPSSVSMANLGNGNADAVVTNRDDDTVSVLLGNGTGTVGTATAYDLGGGDFPLGNAVGDLGNGKPDVVIAAANTANPPFDIPLGSVVVLEGNGDGTLGTATNYFLNGALSPSAIAIAKLVSTSGTPDVVTADEGSSNVSVLLGNGDGTLGGATNFSTGDGTSPDGVAVAALVSGTSTSDIVTSDAEGNVSVLLGNGDGTFAAPVLYSLSGKNALSVVVADLTSNGIPDIVTSNGDGTVSVLLGNGDGTFGAATMFSSDPGVAANQVVAGDLNGDGVADLATANDDGTISVLLGNGDGTFATATSYELASESSAQGIALGDLNNDGRADIATANTGNDVSILLNSTQGTPSIATTPSGAVPAGGVVSDSATISGGINPAGTVTFDLYGPGNTTCTGTPLSATTGTLSGGTASSGNVVVGQGGTYRWVATYDGSPFNATATSPCGSETTAVSSACTTTITSPVAGSLTVSSGKTCVVNTSVSGSVTVTSGASLALTGATVTGSVHTNSASDLTLCGSTVHGTLNVSGSSSMVLVGDGGSTNCAGNTLSTISIGTNTGGLTVGANTIGGSAAINSNTAPGSPTSDQANAIIISGNHVSGALACSGNTPAPVNNGVANSVAGGRSGQCSGPF